MEGFMDYSKEIKAYREREFLTQEDLARLLGVSFSTVNRWEKGKFEPTMKMKKRLFFLFQEEKNNEGIF
jgi:DNA-binding XRE family transcriptional regulator